MEKKNPWIGTTVRTTFADLEPAEKAPLSELIEDGWHQAVIKDCRLTQTRDDRPRVIFMWEILDGKYKHWRICQVITGNHQRLNRRYASLIGRDTIEGADTKDFSGVVAVIRVDHRKFGSTMSNCIYDICLQNEAAPISDGMESNSTKSKPELTTYQKLEAMGINFHTCIKCGKVHGTRAAMLLCHPDTILPKPGIKGLLDDFTGKHFGPRSGALVAADREREEY